MTSRSFKHAWTCAGCGTVFDIETRVDERRLRESPNPAKYIALEKVAMQRTAAIEHARKGCERPV